MEVSVQTTRMTSLKHRLISVKIVEVESPSLLWVHLQRDVEKLHRLETDLGEYMDIWSFCFALPTWTPEVGRDVAIQEDKKWHRGHIYEINGNHARIGLKDWGRVVWRTVTDCYELPEEFTNLNWMAIPCAIAYVGPVTPSLVWDPMASTLARVLAKNKSAWMLVLEGGPSGGAYVEVDINRGPETSGSFSLGYILIETGHAARIEEKGSSTLPNLGRGIHYYAASPPL